MIEKCWHYLLKQELICIRIKDLNKALIRREAHSLSMRDLKQQGQLVYYKLAEEFFNS